MLEHRPLIRNAVTAGGAFMFVFTAAMAGSAFMITGGIGYAEPGVSRSSGPEYAPVAAAPAPPPAFERTEYMSTSAYRSGLEQAAYSREEPSPFRDETLPDEDFVAAEPELPSEALEGQRGSETVALSEEQVRGQIERAYEDALSLEAEAAPSVDAVEAAPVEAAELAPVDEEAAVDDRYDTALDAGGEATTLR